MDILEQIAQFAQFAQTGFPEITGVKKTLKNLQEVPNSLTILCTEVSRLRRANILQEFINSCSRQDSGFRFLSRSSSLHNFYIRVSYNGTVFKFFIKPDPQIKFTRTGLPGTLFVKTKNPVVYNKNYYYEFKSSKELKQTVLGNLKSLNLTKLEEDFIQDVLSFRANLRDFKFEYSKTLEALLVPFGEVITALFFLEGIVGIPDVREYRCENCECSVLFPVSSRNPQSDFLIRYKGDCVFPISSKTGRGHPMAILPLLKQINAKDIPESPEFKSIRDLKEHLDSGMSYYEAFFFYALDDEIIKDLEARNLSPETFFGMLKELSGNPSNLNLSDLNLSNLNLSNLNLSSLLKEIKNSFEKSFSYINTFSCFLNFPLCIPYLGVKKLCYEINSQTKNFILSYMDASLFQARLNTKTLKEGRLEVNITKVNKPSKIDFLCPSGSNDFRLSHGALGISV